MLLCVDVGNTQTTLGLMSRKGELLQQWRMATNARDTSDELHERLFGYFQMFQRKLSDVDEICVASVVPILSQQWEQVSRDALGLEPMMVDAHRDCGITIDVPNPQNCGADRIANALAARERYGAPVIVVDFGTATNIDVVNKEGSFCGGTISPGLLLSAQSLFSRAAKLASVPLVCPPCTLAKTTETNVQAGIVTGAAAQAEGLVARIRKELKSPDAPVIATGGYAKTVSEATDLFAAIDSDLTLRGIYLIWKHRAEKRAKAKLKEN